MSYSYINHHQNTHTQNDHHSHRLWTWQDKLHLYYRFQAKAKAHPNRVFVVFEGKPYTYKQLEKGKTTTTLFTFQMICVTKIPAFSIQPFGKIKLP